MVWTQRFALLHIFRYLFSSRVMCLMFVLLCFWHTMTVFFTFFLSVRFHRRARSIVLFPLLLFSINEVIYDRKLLYWLSKVIEMSSCNLSVEIKKLSTVLLNNLLITYRRLSFIRVFLLDSAIHWRPANSTLTLTFLVYLLESNSQGTSRSHYNDGQWHGSL